MSDLNVTGRRQLNRLGWLAMPLLALAVAACAADTSKEGIGVGITGLDHLDDHLSVQNFWVQKHWGGRAGGGGSTACCAILPRKWQSGMKVHVEWNVTNWRDRNSQTFERDVPVEPYDEVGQLWVHFLKDGGVRVVSSNYAPEAKDYPGPHDVIPSKHPWAVYPWPSDSNE